MRVLIIGSGKQGRACAYDMLQNPAIERITLADNSPARLHETTEWLNDRRVTKEKIDANDTQKIGALASKHDVMVSAVPYFFNLKLAETAIASRCGFIDLGGSTAIVLQELALHEQARAAGVTIIPDCGLGPGMINTIATHGIQQLETVDEVLIRDGGLPQQPQNPPLNYALFFSVHGLINEYAAKATALRNFERVEVDGLGDLEVLDLPPPLGRCEAGHAAGGLSTMAWTFAGKVRHMDNKLIRYPGHIGIMQGLMSLGFFDTNPVTVGDKQVVPRELACQLLDRALIQPETKDLVVIRVVVRGKKDNRRAEITYDMVDYFDEKTGLSAMERTTGFSASIVAQMVGRKQIPAGAYPVEVGVPPNPFFEEAKGRGFDIRWKLRWLDEAKR